MASDGLPGIFCIEGEWNSDLTSRLSVRPLLELLEHLDVAQWVHRDAATLEEFEFYLKRWIETDGFPVLFLAMHGTASLIDLLGDGSGAEVTLDDLEDRLRGACSGKVIYIGSCSTLKDSDARLKQFAKATKARAIIGYRKNVDWTQAAAFEVLLLQELVRNFRAPSLFKRLVNDHPVLAKSLGLVVATRTDVFKAPLKAARTPAA